MGETSFNQFYSFLFFIGIGILIVLIFDIFRILRKSFKTADYVTIIEDIIFVIIVGFILLYSIFLFDNGTLRFYIILGIGIGAMLYICTISKIFIKVNVTIITFIKNVLAKILKIICYPFIIIFKFIRRKLFKPFLFIFVNSTKFIKNNKGF